MLFGDAKKSSESCGGENGGGQCSYDGMLRESDLYVKNRIRKAV